MYKYLDTATVKRSVKFYKITLPSGIILTKDYVSTSDEQVENLNREFNIHYRACIGLLISLLSNRVYLSFSVHKLSKFLSNASKVNFEVLVYLLRYIRDNKTLGLKYYDNMKDALLYELFRQYNIKTENKLMVLSGSS